MVVASLLHDHVSPPVLHEQGAEEAAPPCVFAQHPAERKRARGGVTTSVSVVVPSSPTVEVEVGTFMVGRCRNTTDIWYYTVTYLLAVALLPPCRCSRQSLSLPRELCSASASAARAHISFEEEHTWFKVPE